MWRERRGVKDTEHLQRLEHRVTPGGFNHPVIPVSLEQRQTGTENRKSCGPLRLQVAFCLQGEAECALNCLLQLRLKPEVCWGLVTKWWVTSSSLSLLSSSSSLFVAKPAVEQGQTYIYINQGSSASGSQCLMIWGGTDVIRIEIKCTISVTCLNRT